jgi:DNA-binding response OmpR family regulator
MSQIYFHYFIVAARIFTVFLRSQWLNVPKLRGTGAAPVAQKRVLLIDDDIELLRQMSAAFSLAGYQVRPAPDGKVGLARFTAEPPDLVVTDIIMPTREGVETIVALRRASQDVKIIAISGGYRVGPDEFLTLARHVGADAVLPKPFRLAKLVMLADGLLRDPVAASAA